MRYYILISFVFIALLSCNNTQNNKSIASKFENIDLNKLGASDIENIKIHQEAPAEIIKIPANLGETLPLSSVVDSVWYVKLETNDSCIMGNISQLIPYDDKFFIFDSESVFIFNSSGDFLNKISNLGKGPGEYVLPLFFTIDRFKDEILIYDDKISKILYYDLNGKWLREHFVKYRFSEFSVLAEDSYLIHSYKRYNDHIPAIQNYQLLIADHQWNLLGRGMIYNSKRQRNSNILGGSNFSVLNGSTIYFPPFGDTIYDISVKQGLTPKYVIDFGERKLPENFDFDLSIRGFLDKYNNSEYAYILGDNKEMDDVLFLKIKYRKTNVYGFFSKLTGDFYCSNQILTDIKCLGFPPPIASLPNNILISNLSSHTISNAKEELKKIQGFSTNVKDIINTTNETDNDVLAFYKLKEF